MVTQEPHLCENCGHVDPLELPYCGFCGHPNQNAAESGAMGVEVDGDTLTTTPSVGTAAAAAELADLISGPGGADAAAEEPVSSYAAEAPAPAGAEPEPEPGPVSTDFDFNADVVVADEDDLELPPDLAAAVGDDPVQWGDPGEWAEPPPPVDPFAEDFTGGAAVGAGAAMAGAAAGVGAAAAPAGAPVDPIAEALLTGTVPPGVSSGAGGAGGAGSGSTAGFVTGGSGQPPKSGNRSRRGILILTVLIVIALIIAVVLAVSGGSNKSGSTTTTTSGTPTTGSSSHTTTGNGTHTTTRGVVIAGTSAAPWTNVGYPQQYAVGHLFTLTCPTANACWAVGASATGAEILATTDGGNTWVSQTYPPSTNLGTNGHLFSIYCATTSACVAVGTAPTGSTSQLIILATTNGGTTWTQQTYPPSLTSAHLFSVTCATATACWALGGQSDGTPIILATTDGGNTWALQTYPSGLNLAGSGFLSIDCPSAQDCEISASSNGGLEIIATTNGGTTWTQQPLPASLTTKTNGIGSISCSGPKFCVITGYSSTASGNPPVIVATDDGGSSWHASPYPSSLGLTSLTGVWCPSTHDCWALGNDAAGAIILTTTDGGKSWALQNYGLSLGKNDLVSLSCPTVSTCWIVGVGATNVPVILVARKS